MKHSHHFEYGRIILLPLERNDIEELRTLRNREREYFLTTDEVKAENQIKWYEAYLKKDNDIMFKITHKDNPDDFIGAIAVYGIDYEKKTAEIGRTLIDKTKNNERGLGLEATKAICLFSFVVLGMHILFAEVLKSNERILKVDTRAGFYISDVADETCYSIEMTRDTLNLY